MAGRRRGARSGRGWDAAPPRPRRTTTSRSRRTQPNTGGETSQWPPDEQGWPEGAHAERPQVPLPRSGGGSVGPAGANAAGGRATAGRAAPADRDESRDEAERAREICLRQLAVRPRTRAELATVLIRRGISEGVVALVLDRYDQVGMIDDAAFARAWVTSRHHGRGLARRALATELRQRGVDAEITSDALEELDETTEAATARALVDRKLRTSTGRPDAVFRRLVGMLARKGYPAGLAIRTVKDALAAQSAEAAEFAEQIDADALIDAEAEVDRESRSTE